MSESTPRGAYALFCDEIRTEDTGKFLFVGVYGDLMYIGGTPQILPSFSIYCSVWTDMERPFQALTFRVYLGEDVFYEDSIDPATLSERNAQIPSVKDFIAANPHLGTPRLEIRRILRFNAFPIPKELTIRVRVQTELEELRAGGLTIKAHPGSAQVDPSADSQLQHSDDVQD